MPAEDLITVPPRVRTKPEYWNQFIEPVQAISPEGGAGDYRTALSWDADGNAKKAGAVVSPLLFGAVGDGVTDDSAALAGMFATLGLTSVGISDASGIIIDGHNREYAITDTIAFEDVWHLTFQNFRFVVTAPIAGAAVSLNGVAYSNLENIHIRASPAWSATNTIEYGFQIESNQGAGGSVTTSITLKSCSVLDVRHEIAFAIGVNSANLQVSEINCWGCRATGQYLSVGGSTWFQAGFQFGSGTQGNILTHQAFGCTANNYKYSLHVWATDIKWFGGSLDQGDAAIYHSSGLPLVVVGLRSEGCNRLLDTPGGTDAMPRAMLQGIQLDGNEFIDDGSGIAHIIRWNFRSQLKVFGMTVSAVDVSLTPKIKLAHSSINRAFLVDISAPVAKESLITAAGGFVDAAIFGFEETDHDGAPVGTDDVGIGLVNQTPINAFTIGNPPDASMYRKTAYPGMYFPARTFFGTSVELWNDGAGSIMFRIRDAAGANDYIRIMDHGEILLGDGTSAPDVLIKRGTGSPEGVETASPGSMFLSTNGNIYRKSTGTGNTGWVAM